MWQELSFLMPVFTFLCNVCAFFYGERYLVLTQALVFDRNRLNSFVWINLQSESQSVWTHLLLRRLSFRQFALIVRHLVNVDYS